MVTTQYTRLCGNGCTHNNGRIAGYGVFYALCAEVIYGELRQSVAEERRLYVCCSYSGI
jgi:hypothetical protein